jgi:SH3-like domain-containing protein
VGGILVGSLIFLAMILTIGIAALLFAVGLMGLLISGLFGSRDDWTENLLGPGCLTLLITLPLLYGLVWLAERLGPRSIPLVDPTAAHLIRWLNLGNSEWAFPALRATLAITGLIGLGVGGVLGAWGGFHLGRHWPGLTLLGLVGMVPLTMFAYPRMNRPFLDGTVPGITRGISMPSSGASSSSSRGASSSPAGSPMIPLACVKGDQGLRTSPGGAVQSRVAHGTPVWILEEGQAWSRVRTPGGAVGHLPAKALERAPRTDRPLTCVRATERLRLREGPGTGYRILEHLKPATPLEVLTREGNWIRVRTPEGKAGFVDAQWVFWPPLDPTSTP